MTIQLFHSFTSPYARKARVVLIEKGIPFDAIDVATSAEQASRYNPLGKVPTLVLDDGTVLFDSTVIVEALDALHPNPRLIPENPMQRALVRRWEAVADGICDVLIPVILDARRPEPQQDRVFAEKMLGKVRAGLDFVQEQVKGQKFLHGEDFTLADIAITSMLGYLNLRRPDLLAEGYPELHRYSAEQLRRASLRDTVPPNLPVRG
ncbi:MAG TPA: glutathione S-transferase family protein [Polyangiaceae bacterium]